MKIGELISELSEIKDKYGDIQISSEILGVSLKMKEGNTVECSLRGNANDFRMINPAKESDIMKSVMLAYEFL
jgi:hypothetical protein